MPTLCRAGVLVECCALGIPAHEGSRDAPAEYPSGCPCDGDGCSNNTESPEPRDCDSCAESCNVVSTHSKQSDDDFAVLLVVGVVSMQAPNDALPQHEIRTRDLSTARLREHLPIPISDRPLLI